MNTQQLSIRQIMVIGLATCLTLFLNFEPVTAQTPVEHLASPYYGALNNNVSQRWIDNQHFGIDFLLRWAPVLAAADGTIEYTGWYNTDCHDEEEPNCTNYDAGFGLHTRIRHNTGGDNPYYSYYAHLSVARTTPESIERGEWVGTSGDSGWSTGPHLHFEVRHGGILQANAVNPDDEDGLGNDLWSGGEWSDSDPTVSHPEWGFPTQGLYGNQIIVDDGDAGFSKGCDLFPGCPNYWVHMTNAGYNGDYYRTYENNDTLNDWAHWTPSLPASGNYHISAWMPCGPNNNDNPDLTTWQAPYAIQIKNGSSFNTVMTVIVDQLTLSRYDSNPIRTGCNRWINLGVHYATAGSNTRLRLTDNSGETSVLRKIGADAVKFWPINLGPFEAEDYRNYWDHNHPPHDWQLKTNLGGYSGSGFMQVLPNTGLNISSGYSTTSPELRYRLAFPTAGTYYLWLRGAGDNAADDSVHAGVDNTAPSSAQRITCNPEWRNGSWAWCSIRDENTGDPRVTITVNTPGLHTLSLWMREDGFRVDKVLLTQDAGYSP